MAKTKISEFSSTPANNTDIDSINIAEGCAPSGINDAIRELMAQLKDFQTGAQGDSFNGPIGTSTAAAGAFTTLSATGAITSTLATGTAPLVIASTTKVANLNVDLLDGADWASPAALGSTTPAAVSATTLSASSTVTLSGGTANGVAYLNGSKVVTSGSALTFDGTNLALGRTALAARILTVQGRACFTSTANDSQLAIYNDGSTNGLYSTYNSTGSYLPMAFFINDAEQMRLTSTGLGIGTSSPAEKLQVAGTIRFGANATYYGTLAHDATTTGANIYNSQDSGGHLFQNSGSTVLTLNNSGNLGLGVTPSAWGSTYRALQVGLTASLVGLTNDTKTHLSTNASFDGTDWRYIATSPASRYAQIDNQHQWYNAPSGTAGNAITFTQAMTLDARGNLLVGTTSGGSQRMRLAYSIASTNDPFSDGTATLALQNLNSTSGNSTSISNFDASGDQNAYIRFINVDQNFASAITFGTATSGASNYGERARIDSSGNLLVGQTSTGSGGLVNSNSAALTLSSNGSCWTMNHSATSAGSLFAQFGYSGTKIGSITVATSSTVAYNTSSDYRLKENIAPMTGALAKVALLKPCTYTWKIDGSNGQGFIAHELAEVCPEAVTGEKDAVNEDGTINPQGIDTSFLVATLTAAIQELKAEFDAYKASHP